MCRRPRHAAASPQHVQIIAEDDSVQPGSPTDTRKNLNIARGDLITGTLKQVQKFGRSKFYLAGSHSVSDLEHYKNRSRDKLSKYSTKIRQKEKGEKTNTKPQNHPSEYRGPDERNIVMNGCYWWSGTKSERPNVADRGGTTMVGGLNAAPAATHFCVLMSATGITSKTQHKTDELKSHHVDEEMMEAGIWWSWLVPPTTIQQKARTLGCRCRYKQRRWGRAQNRTGLG
ncbi:hypothetical protein B0H19DRAFT_1068691 [Mycena capillaripes]|nr:hypothetical protein B0H19DRAFT_1068691 [Mycena capillaripes]